jgi:hypothetical protein
MKNHFNLSRFGLLFRKHTTEHIKTYLMALGVLLGSLFLVIGWVAYIDPRPMREVEQTLFFAFFLMGAGTIFTSTVFANLSGKSRAIATLMLPASQLEKYLVGWLYSFVLFLLVYTASFYLVINLVLALDPQPTELVNIFKEKNFASAMLLMYALLHGIAIWGAVAFEKLAFIKTAFAFFIVVFLVLVINYFALEWMFGRDLQNAVPFSEVRFQEKDHFYDIKPSEIAQNSLMGLSWVLIGMLLWLASFVRLKEKQI